MSESLRFLGSMEGHKGWVTAIATSSENPDMILTASRGTLQDTRIPISNPVLLGRQNNHRLANDPRGRLIRIPQEDPSRS